MSAIDGRGIHKLPCEEEEDLSSLPLRLKPVFSAPPLVEGDRSYGPAGQDHERGRNRKWSSHRTSSSEFTGSSRPWWPTVSSANKRTILAARASPMGTHVSVFMMTPEKAWEIVYHSTMAVNSPLLVLSWCSGITQERCLGNGQTGFSNPISQI